MTSHSFKQAGESISSQKIAFQDPDTTAFRLFNGEGDGIGGFTIDYYDGYYLFQWYSKGIYTLKETIMEALDELTDYKAVYEKNGLIRPGSMWKMTTLSKAKEETFRSL